MMKKNQLNVLIFLFIQSVSFSQNTSWKLWGSGLPSGAYPRMVVAPSHDIFYSLLGTGSKIGYIYKANVMDSLGIFTEMPKVPVPASLQNNIVALGYNANSEPLAGIYRTNINEPWLFRYNNSTKSWDTCLTNLNPTLGGQCIATSKSGVIYVTTKWSFIYKSVDNGVSFTAIDESKILASQYPCYYPSFLNKSANDGALFTVVIDGNNRIYAGTETSGVIYSDDEGATWHPADLFACQDGSLQYDTLSKMAPITRSGNVAGIGFTKNNNVVWSGVDMWYYGWKNKIGFANMQDSTVSEITGLPDYLVQTGQQVSKIVTTTNGTMFLHSGSSTGATQIGIYRSFDGVNWEYFNNGIIGGNNNLSQGSLAVDGNKVFMATSDGKVWMFDAENTTPTNQYSTDNIICYPSPTTNRLTIQNVVKPIDYWIVGLNGKVVKNGKLDLTPAYIDLQSVSKGIYILKLQNSTLNITRKFVKE